ncbi:hypothetical protein [Arthrobacter sp. Soil761]|uniref:hypothetical protein n=1 Tax=Arthrobacter sp. Soil761 TaxID=1736400 RepID=UPI0006F4A694|nr:hypothetical protein [Arthrobacter sp. Soil761]KRE64444.1 hypothetical protein ASG79_15745 [Arthrobacter sp. Soil761]
MNDSPRFIVNFHTESGDEWQTDEARYIPRAGDRMYPYEGAPKGFFEVEEVWEVGESNGAVVQGTHVFLKEIPAKGTRLYQVDPFYYDS